MLAYESAPQTTLFQQLLDAGCELPGPEALADTELTAKLSNMIDALALLRVFIGYTDHLSDRELYTRLWVGVLRREIPILPVDPRAAWHLDLLGSGSEDDTNSYLKHYADDEDRRRWLVQFPDYAMPPRKHLPYDRDHTSREPIDLHRASARVMPAILRIPYSQLARSANSGSTKRDVRHR